MSKAMVKHINPDEMMEDSAFSQAVEVSGNVRTIYIGGQNAFDETGMLVGQGNLEKQAEQIFINLEILLRHADAKLEHIVKWNIYVLAGTNPQPAFEAFQRIWGNRGKPPVTTLLFVAGLAHRGYLMELDAIAVVQN